MINESIRTQQDTVLAQCFNYPNDPLGGVRMISQSHKEHNKTSAREYLQRYINAMFYAMLGLLNVKTTVAEEKRAKAARKAGREPPAPKGVFSTLYIYIYWLYMKPVSFSCVFFVFWRKRSDSLKPPRHISIPARTGFGFSVTF